MVSAEFFRLSYQYCFSVAVKHNFRGNVALGIDVHAVKSCTDQRLSLEMSKKNLSPKNTNNVGAGVATTGP